MPAHTWLYTIGLNTSVMADINELNEIYIAAGIWHFEARAYESHFGRELSKNEDGGDVVITRLASDGRFVDYGWVGELSESDVLVDIQATNSGPVMLLANRYKQPTQGSGTTEWDMSIFVVDKQNLNAGNKYRYDLELEDRPIGFIETDKGYAIYGQKSFRQVDTNSQVSFGVGFVLDVNTDFSIGRLLELPGPRSVTVRDLVIDGSRLKAVVTYDEPITHTCDDDDSLCFVKSDAISLPAF